MNRNIYLLIIGAWLITIAIVVDNYWSPNSSQKSVQKKVEGHINKAENDFKALMTDTSFLNKIKKGNYDDDFIEELNDKKYFLFFYRPDSINTFKLFLWNTQLVQPSPQILYLKDRSGFTVLQNGYYVWNNYGDSEIKVLALIPVKWNYIVTNEYLQNGFAVNGITPNYDITLRKNGGIVRSIFGTELFYIEKKSDVVSLRNNTVAVWFRILSAFIILLFIHLMADHIASLNLGKGILFFFITVLFIRICSYYFPIPINFRQFELFDPSIYGSNMVLRSLGDLLINSILFLWFIFFLRSQTQLRSFEIKTDVPWKKWTLVVLGSLLIVAITFTGTIIIRTLVSDSQISFDVINFFTLNIYSIIGFIILCCIAIGYYFFAQIIIYLLKPLFPKNYIPLVLSITCIGLLLLSFRVGLGNGGELFVLLWLLFFLFLLNTRILNLLSSHIISSKLVFWLFFFSISITSLIIIENGRKELRNRQHYAEILSTKADPSSETLINSMLTDFREDYLSENFYKFTIEYTNQAFKDSLLQGNLSGYTERYGTEIFSFDAREKPLFNTDLTDFNELNTILHTQGKPTGIPDLFYYDVSYDKFSYISKKVLKNSVGQLLGYVFIIASPKKFKNELYPELFGRGQNNSIENSSQYAFAIYNNWKLINSHNDYPFATTLNKKDFPRQEFFEKKVNGFNELWYKFSPDRVVVIAKESSVSIESITLFSYLFCSFLFLSFMIWLVNIFVSSRFNFKKLKTYWQLSIRNQIHGTIIFISVLSFFVIGIATILFFISRYENNNREKLSRTIRIMENEVKNFINKGWTMSDSFRLNTGDVKQDIEYNINKISQIHGSDVNLYDLDGNLQVSSLPLPYIKGIISTIMDPVAYYHLNNKSEVQYFQKEKIGNLNYVSNYIPVIDAAGNKFAYLNIPYFTSQSNLRDEISNFLVTIINLNAFIFLIAGIVALFITNRITNSFSLIGDKMKMVNLGKRNEAIFWNRADEIGELVIEYNKMVSKLDASAEALAKTEREGAWREMAKQIAHEIKNPLTPMKLSMQYLQKSIEQNAPNVKELSATVANTLVEQIDHLSHIAGEFSQFANIENLKLEIVNLNDVLGNVLQLYSVNDKLTLVTSLVNQDIFIEADKSHINRVFTNLLQNAMQSVDEDQKVIIHIDEKLDDKNIIISIRDNGAGIEESIQSKIFTPNFTTKTSGTGLGLAMCKRMVEQAKGDIWFATIAGGGTAFYVKLPLYVQNQTS
ncbi:MAG: HAMP domain-containing sensor histidine kinase [Ferruginibacter sp.]